jgi:hypothetical protein
VPVGGGGAGQRRWWGAGGRRHTRGGESGEMTGCAVCGSGESVHGDNYEVFAVHNFFVVCPKSLSCISVLCRASAHDKDPLPCQAAFVMRQCTAKNLCHVQLHDKDP